jgi:hypothetical protein
VANQHTNQHGNRESGEIDLIVKGRHYVIRPGLKACMQAEALTGKTTIELMEEAQRGSVTAAVSLMWAYLQKYHAAEFPSVDEAIVLIEALGGLEELNKALQAAHDLNMAEKPPSPTKGAGAPDPTSAPVGTGEKSSLPDLVSA